MTSATEKANFIDCHSHLSFLALADVHDHVTIGLRRGLGHWVLGGYDSSDWERQLVLKEKLPERFHTSFGIHPWRLAELNEEQLRREMQNLKSKLPQADFIGETGLDFYRASNPEARNLQKEAFVEHLLLAGHKPVVLHIVQAHQPAIDILRQYKINKGLVHRFTGSFPVAEQYMNLGLMLSIGPDILHKRAKLADVVQQIPMDNLLVESDAPGHLGDQSDPVAKFFQVADAVANLKAIRVTALLEKATANMRKLIKDGEPARR